jgi:hypothetical protein
VIELNNSASSANDRKDKNNECNHKEDMDIRTEYVEADESEQPQNQKDYKNGPQHSLCLLYDRSLVPVISCALGGRRLPPGTNISRDAISSGG